MRIFEVDWRTFAEKRPEPGVRIVAEIERPVTLRNLHGSPPTHRSECVTGAFRNGWLERRNGGVHPVKSSDRWYLAGSERPKVRP